MRLLLSVLTVLFCTSSCSSQSNADKAKSTSFTIASRDFLRKKQYDSARYSIDQALKYDPKNWAAYNNRAILKYRTGASEDEVVADFKKALELMPNYEISLYSLANYYDETRKYQKAVDACDNYLEVSKHNDFDSVEAINRLRQLDVQKLRESQILVGGVSVLRARRYYDSINAAVDQSHPIEQRFIDNLGRTMLSLLNHQDTGSIDIAALRVGLDSAEKANALKIEKLTNITEIDTSIGYKKIVLDYASSFDEAYRKVFKSYIEDLNTRDVSLIKQSSKNIQAPMKAIKQKELIYKKAKEDFETKYGLYHD